MKVCLVQSGGFAGTVKRCEVDTETLDPSEARQLQQLVSDSGLNKSGSAFNEEARDLNQYEITIEDTAQEICMTFDEHNVPASARQLLGFLKQRVKPGKL
ncbi:MULTISPECIES: protealysin inhibitor emfourin [Pseudomonas syringae group]|uniref:Protealysin inhibitor emfourin n=4 Tax=Pseudomonas syringae group TaxID=136849 RepID=A0AA40TW64_9PSED|nr:MULTISPECIES: protealysin inhibitor emfourin [Pseudomonas syringae group]KGS14444.1 hypothetical protein OA77_11080 [Pseudomonas coronafaciens]KOP53865.1 hypothetical protein OX90_20780 [Pseudomonas coronafaciens pv. porri]KOP56176.1 hypothetical protein OX88_10350 [Pseudomonas coronafaciens pv. porri]KPB49896.1 Uncharacterized protein AC511_2302 [Pseudomonas coronafaciens pv. oryzae]KPW34997.1 Uncharacterized protein ALO66_04224 [Pseudomonas coronafaciens pv. atropurpurea]